MKIKRSTSATSTKRYTPMTAEMSEFLGKASVADDSGLLELLEPLQRVDSSRWPFGRSDLHNWADLLDLFDGFYEEVIGRCWDRSTGCQNVAFRGGDEEARLIVSMLGFTRCLLEYCSSRNLFNSYEHLRSLMASSHPLVLEATLELLALPARKLDAQPSLRKTFQETVGLEELAFLAGLNHPPFIEIHSNRTKQPDMESFRRLGVKVSGTGKLLAMSIYLLFMGTLDVELDSSLFSAQPTVIGDVARSLMGDVVGKERAMEASTDDGQMRRETAVLGVLRAALKVPSKSQEVVYALSLSASHGPVVAILRTLCQSLHLPVLPYHQFFVSAFLDFCTALSLSPEADLALIHAGLVEELVRGALRSDPPSHSAHYKITERMLTVLDILMHRLGEANDAFFAAEGLHAVVSQIKRLVQRPAVAPESSAEASSEVTSLADVAMLNTHLRLVDRLLTTSGGDDRMRNLVEGGLFKALRQVFEAPAMFPAETLSFSTSILSSFIHHEPTSLTFLQEQGVPLAFLTCLLSHPLPAQSDLLVRLPQAFSALCLNQAGVEQFKASNPIERLLGVFLDPDTYLKPLKAQMAASEMGRGLDEFMRHQPSFRDEAIQALINVLAGVPAMLQRTPLHILPEQQQQVTGTTKKREAHPGLTMFNLFTITLESVLQSPGHARAFISHGGIDCLFQAFSSPGLPYDFPSRIESQSMAHLFRLLTETPLQEQGTERRPEEVAVLLATAWKHVFTVAPLIRDHFLAHHQPCNLNPGSFFLSTPPSSSSAEVFTAMCGLQAILKLLGDLYLEQHTFAAARQAAQILPGLTTPEGEAAMLFLSLLLGASVAERLAVEKAVDPAHLDAIKKIEQGTADPSVNMAGMQKERMVLYVSGQLPGLVMSLLGGVSRMLSFHSSSKTVNPITTPPASLQSISSLLANSLATNFSSLPPSSPEACSSLLGLASNLFFDEASSRLGLQILPLTTFAQIGGLSDLSGSVHTILAGDGEGVLEVVELYLALLGRVTSAQTYRVSTWDDLESVAFPAGLRSWLVLASRTVLWAWTEMPLALWSRLQPKHIRLLLALTTNLMVKEAPPDAKPQEQVFYRFLEGTIAGTGTEKFPIQDNEDLSPMAWLKDSPLTILPALVERAYPVEQVAYDLAQLFLHLLPDAASWLSVTASSSPSVKARYLAILLSSHRRLDFGPQIADACIKSLLLLTDSEESVLLLAGSILSLMESETIPIDSDFISWSKNLVIPSTNDPSVMHAALYCLMALTRLNMTLTPEEVASLVPSAIDAALTGFETDDLRHRSMLSLAILSIRHLVESPSYLGLLLPAELLAKHRAHSHRRLPLALLVTPAGERPTSTSWQLESLALRSRTIFTDSLASCFSLDPEVTGGEEENLVARSNVMTLEYKKSLQERLYALEESANASPVIEALIDAFMATPSLPVFSSAPESVRMEKEEKEVVQAHFRRMAILSTLSELISTLPVCHAALLASPSLDALLHRLFSQVVPCGDLATTGQPASSTLFVSGPVWVDHFLAQLCLGSSVPGLPAPIERMKRTVSRVIGILAAVLEEETSKTGPEMTPFARMSRIWCLSMTVYSMLNMRGGAHHRQTEAAQASISKAMLEKRFLSILAGVLASLRNDWPAHAMVSAKLVLNLETLARHAKTLKQQMPKTSVPIATPSAAQEEANPIDMAVESAGEEEDDDHGIRIDGSSSDEEMREEPFGYAHSSSDMSGESIDEMSLDLDGMDTDDSDSEGDDDDGMDTDSDDDDDMDTSDSEDVSGSEGESVRIVIEPGEAGSAGESDEDEDDLNAFYDEHSIQEDHDHHHHMFTDDEGEDDGDLMMGDEEEYDSGEDEMLAADTDDFASSADDDDDDQDENDHDDGGDEHHLPRRGAWPRPGHRLSIDALFETMLGDGSGTGPGPFNTLAARGAVSGDLYVHPLLGRSIDAPACLSTRQTDLALFLRSSSSPSSTSQAIVMAPFRLSPEAGRPFNLNREALRNPGSVATSRRWSQAARLLHGPADLQAKVLADLVSQVRDRLIGEWEDARRQRMEVEQSTVAVGNPPVDNPSADDTPVETDTSTIQTEATESAVPPAEAVPPQDFLDEGPDADFLLALPFDMRTEVIQQYLSQERRSTISASLGPTCPVNLTISPTFLGRLPDDLRAEYSRLSERDVERYNRRVARTAGGTGGTGGAREMFEQFLREQGLEDLIEGDGGAPAITNAAPAAIPDIQVIGEGNAAAPGLAAFLQRITQSLRPPEGTRIQVRVHDPSTLSALSATAGGRSTPSRGGAALLDTTTTTGAEEEEVPAGLLSIDRATLATLLRSYYEPTMSDKRTHHRLLSALASLPLTTSSPTTTDGHHHLVREEMVRMLIQVLESMPSDLAELWDTLSPVRLGSKRKEVSGQTSAQSSHSVVILQRTLQLLLHLATHDEPTRLSFTRPLHPPWTVRRRKSGGTTAAGGYSSHETRYPIVLLLACLEKSQILQVGLLVEFLLSLLATVSAPIKSLVQKAKNVPSAVHLPVIPAPFVLSLVKALGASELTPKALSHATTIFQNLARLDGLSPILLAHLADASVRVAEQATRDMELGDQSVTEMVRRLSGPTAAQTRLVRLAKMMLVLPESTNSLSERLKTDSAWSAFREQLPKTLSLIEASDAPLLHSSATALLPSIEALFLHHRLTTTAHQDVDELVLFAEAHRKLLNTLIRATPSLLATTGSFHPLTLTPRLLDFDNKRAHFKSQLTALRRSTAIPAGPITLNVRRSHVFEDSYHQLIGRTGEELRGAKLTVKFHGEEGVDAGGVTREWFSELSKQLFNPDNGLFLPSASDSVALQPNRASWVNPDHLQFFSFAGRIIAKAIVDARLLDVHFTRSFYKHMLGLSVDFRDLEAIDPDYYKSLRWILDNDITGVLDLTFAAESDEFGVVRQVELKPGGLEMEVTEANKAEYVRLVTEFRLTTAIRPQIDAVLSGLHALIPPALLSIFGETELELLISGLPDIDLDDWRANTDYRNYSIASPQVQWFWRAVRSFDPEERAKLVQFVTGTSKVPLDGWAHLQGSSGRQKFSITKDFGPVHRLPSAHTCFNQLDLPAYESYEELRDQLLKAITEGASGFGLV